MKIEIIKYLETLNEWITDLEISINNYEDVDESQYAELQARYDSVLDCKSAFIGIFKDHL